MEKQLNPDDFLDCIHCGLCLTSCPTYTLLGNEADSPRGRIYLMRSLAEATIDFTKNVVKHFDTCLECRACETACPSGVHFGELLEKTRNVVETVYKRPKNEKRLRDFILKKALVSDRFLKISFKLASLVNDFGLNFLFRFFPNHTQKILQKLPQTKPFEPLQEFYPAKTQTRFRVVLLEGCVAKYFFNSTNLATIKVLTENNCDVFVPKNQNCCGSLHNHNGESGLANELAFANEKIFSKIKPDFIVTNSAGCGSFLKEFYHKNFPETKVKDICELLVEIGFRKPKTKLSLRIAYHDACHLVHGQKITKQPREILQTIDGIELVNFKESDFCCGSAGIYNVLQPELAQQLLDRKITNLPTEKIDFVATGNPGCTMQIQNGLKSYGLDLQVIHPVEILAKSYEAELLQKQN